MGFPFGVGCHSLLQGVFLTQGLHPSLLLGRQESHRDSPISLIGSGLVSCVWLLWLRFHVVPVAMEDSSVHGTSQARVLEWVAMSFSRGSSQPRDWTWVSCIKGRLFTSEPILISEVHSYSNRWESWVSKKLRDLPEITRWINLRTRIHAWEYLPSNLMTIWWHSLKTLGQEGFSLRSTSGQKSQRVSSGNTRIKV